MASTSSEAEAENATGERPTEYNSPVMSHLRNHLTTLRNLRHGFIEQHGSEPSVSLKYSEQSTSNSTISLRVGNEIDRENYVDNEEDAPMPSTSEAEPVAGRYDSKNDDVSSKSALSKSLILVFISLVTNITYTNLFMEIELVYRTF